MKRANIISDLLVRHERLTHHKENSQKNHQGVIEQYVAPDTRPQKRMRTSFDAGRPTPQIPSMMSTPAAIEMPPPMHHQTPGPMGHMPAAPNDEFSLAALSMAAEYQSLQGTMSNGGDPSHGLTAPMPLHENTIPHQIVQPMMPSLPDHTPVPPGPTLGESLDSLAAFLDNEPFTTYHFASLINTEQPMPFFSPESFSYGQENCPFQRASQEGH